MSKIECTFYRPSAEEWSIDECNRIIKKLKDDFLAICAGEVDLDDTCRYAETLLSYARPLEGNPNMQFLGLISPQTMPAKERVYFFYVQSYLGAAICIRAAVERPEILNDPRRREILRGLLLGNTQRKFHGAGYDWLIGLIQTLWIYAEAGTDSFLQRNWFLCEKFSKLYRDSIKLLEKMISENKVHNVWGTDYTDDASEVISISHQVRNASWYN